MCVRCSTKLALFASRGGAACVGGCAPRRIAELCRAAESKLGYLRMVVPRTAADTVREGTAGSRSYVVRDGAVTPGRGRSVGRAAHSTYREGNVDPDQVARHSALMHRMSFGGREQPRAPTWLNEPGLMPVDTGADDGGSSSVVVVGGGGGAEAGPPAPPAAPDFESLNAVPVTRDV